MSSEADPPQPIPFDWTELLRIAEELAERRDDEAALRTAVGRAYYAVFGVARRRLLAAGIRLPPGGLAHRAVWDALHNLPSSPARRAAQGGRRLLRQRTRADYDSTRRTTPAKAAKALEDAQDALGALDRLSVGSS